MSDAPHELDWADQLALIIARCRFGPGVDMGGRSNPTPSETIAARGFVDDITAAAEQRGYDKAIAKLRDEPRLLAWMKANDDSLYLEDHLLHAAYLEAVRDQP